MSDMTLMMRIGAITDASFHRAFGAANERMGSLNSMHQRMGQNLMTGTAQLAAFSAPLIGVASSAIEFESSMAEVNKTVGFKSTQSLQSFSNEIKNLSKEIPLSVNQLANIAASGGQLGVLEKDLIGFTKGVSKISVAFDMSAEKAGDSMSKLMNSLGEPISKMTEIGDAINAVSNSSPAKASEIINALGRVGQVGKNFGLVKEETIALSSAFIAMGSPAEVAATSVNAMLTTLSTLDPKNKKQRAAFSSLGLDIQKFSKLVADDGQQAIMTLLESINKLPDSEKIRTLTGVFGKEYASQIATLSGGIGTYTNQLRTLKDLDSSGKSKYLGSMSKEFASISGTTKNKLQLFKNNLNLLAINIGETLIPAINKAILAVTPIVQSFSDWAKTHPSLITGIIKVVGGLLLFKVAFSAIAFAIMSVVTPIIKTISAFRMIGSAIGAIRVALAANPILATALAISLVALAIYKNWSHIKSFFVWVWNGIKAAFSTGVAAIKFIVMNFTPLSAFIKLWEVVKPYFSKLWIRLNSFAKSGVGNISRTIINWTPIGLFYRSFAKVMSWFGVTLPAKFTDFGSMIIQGLVRGISNKIGAVKAKISELASLVSGSFKRTLGIQSPSRVFMGFGRNISEGVALGIDAKSHDAIQASDAMAQRLAQTQYSTRVLAQASVASAAAGSSSGGSQQFYFNPTITIGNANADSINDAMQLSFEQFKVMMRRYKADVARGAWT